MLHVMPKIVCKVCTYVSHCLVKIYTTIHVFLTSKNKYTAMHKGGKNRMSIIKKLKRGDKNDSMLDSPIPSLLYSMNLQGEKGKE